MSKNGTGSAMNREKKLLLLCGRKAPGEARIAQIRELSREPLDWQEFFTLAGDHHIGQLAGRHIEQICWDEVPPIWQEYVRSNFGRILRRNLLLSAELLRLMEAFEAAGLQPIPYKGPTLAALAYGNLSLREFGDLDLLFAQGEIGRAQDIMRESGFRTHTRMPGRKRSNEPIPGQYLFWRDDDRYLVELHTEKTLRYFPRTPPIEQLRQRLQCVRVGGHDVPTLGMEDLLNFLCVHGSKHFWNRLQWIADIAELADKTDLTNLPAVLARGHELGSFRMTLLGLRLAEDLLGAQVPEEIRRKAQTDPAVEFMAQRAKEIFLAKRPFLPGIWQRLRFRTAMQGSVTGGIHYTLRLATIPTEEDWMQTKLPSALTPLYAILRPIRLAAKYGAGRRPRAAPDLAPFVPTPPEIARRMLELARLSANDVLYDVGCGDGRILEVAARDFGVQCVGVDLDAQRIAEARARIQTAGVENKVTLIHGDARDVNLSAATVVTLYLTIPGNAKLWRQLNEQLRAGTRVVSRDAGMPGWHEMEAVEMDADDGMHTTLHLWEIGSAEGQPSELLTPSP